MANGLCLMRKRIEQGSCQRQPCGYGLRCGITVIIVIFIVVGDTGVLHRGAWSSVGGGCRGGCGGGGNSLTRRAHG